MKKIIIYLLIFIPTILLCQNSTDNLEKDDYNYIIKVGDVVDCPYLGPKMIKMFEDLGCENVIKNNEEELLSFTSNTLFKEEYIIDIFINKIGIPKWSIYEIQIFENED